MICRSISSAACVPPAERSCCWTGWTRWPALTTARLFSGIVRAFAGRYRDCRYVLTARVAAYQGDAQIGAGFRICTVADLSADQQQRFIANWSCSLHRLLYQAHGEDLERRATRYAGDLWHALELNDRVRGLASNPLLLTVVAVIFSTTTMCCPRIAPRCTRSVSRCCCAAGAARPIGPASSGANYGGRSELRMGLDPKRKSWRRWPTACTCAARGELSIHHDLVIEVAAALRGRYPEPDALARTFVAELPVVSACSTSASRNHFQFSHLSFQEFLAARFIAKSTEQRWDELLDRYRDSWWREVILLCAGHLSQERCWRFLGRLAERGATPDAHARRWASPPTRWPSWSASKVTARSTPASRPRRCSPGTALRPRPRQRPLGLSAAACWRAWATRAPVYARCRRRWSSCRAEVL